MLKSEGWRCSAAGVVARMEWSFTCTVPALGSSSSTSWLLGGLEFANCSVSYVSTSAFLVPGPAVARP